MRGRAAARAGSPSCSPRSGRSRSSSPARPASPPPTTPPATATRSGARCRSGCRRRSPSRCRARSRSSSAATPARHGPFTEREVAAPLRRARDARRSARSRRSRPTSASCAASSARRACAASGATSTCCASCGGVRWPRCAARSSRSSRRRWPASCRRGTASPPSGAASRPGRGARPARRRADRGVDARDRRAAVAGRAATGRRCSTSCARRARWCGSAPGRSGRATAGSGCASPTSCRCWRRAGRCRTVPRARCTMPSALLLAERGASFWSQLRAAAPGTADDELLAALWDLVWAGEVTNDSLAPLRAVTGAGGSRARRGAGDRDRGPGRAPAGSTRIGPPAGAGRWSLVAPLLEPRPTPTEAAHADGAAAARALRRRHPRGRAGRGCRRRVRRGVRRAEGARGARPGPPRLLRRAASAPPSSRCPAPSTGCGSSASGPTRRSAAPAPIAAPVVLAATDPAQPYGAALAWPESAGRPARTAAALVVLRDGVPLAWFDRRSHHLVTFPAHPRRPRRGPRRWPTSCRPVGCAGSRSARSTVSRCRRRRSTPRSRPPPRPPATPTATAGCSTRPARWCRTAVRAVVPVANV